MSEEAERKFQEFLKKYCKKHNLTPEEAQKHLIVCAVRKCYEDYDNEET